MVKQRSNRLRVSMAAMLCIPAVALAQDAGSSSENDPVRRAQTMTQGEVLGPQPGPDHALKTAENPFKNDINAITEGRRLFVWFNCSGCHGGRAGGGMGPSLRDAAWLYGASHADIHNSISEGRPHGMPAWGTKLPSDQIWKLTAYIKSLDTAKEPDPPPENPVFPDPPPRRDIKGVKAGGKDEDKDND